MIDEVNQKQPLEDNFFFFTDHTKIKSQVTDYDHFVNFTLI